jgi:hypothetical protein
MEAGTPLHIAGADGSSEVCGIFVGKHNQNMKIFTSWHAGVDVDGRWRQSHESLGVEVQDSTGTPLLDTVKWVTDWLSPSNVSRHQSSSNGQVYGLKKPIVSLLDTSLTVKLVHPRDHACMLRATGPLAFIIVFFVLATKRETLRRFAWFLLRSDYILFCLFWLTRISSTPTTIDPDGESSRVAGSDCALLDAEGSRGRVASGCWLLDAEDSRRLAKIDSGLATCLSRTSFRPTFL